MYTILLLGGNGLIGSKISEILKETRKFNVFNLDKNDIDLSREANISAIKKRIKKINPNIIIILASIKRQQGDSDEIKNYNDLITKNLSYCLCDQTSKVVYLSSCAVYGEKNNQYKFNENSVLMPTSKYGEHKLQSEILYTQLIDKQRLLIIRPPLIYDIKDINGYHPGGFVYSAQKNKIIKLWGDGNEKREFILIEDAANLIIKLSISDCFGIFNIASGKSFSYRSIAEYISKIIECKIIELDRTGIPVNHSYDNAKLKTIIEDFNFTSPHKAIDNYLSGIL